MAAVSNRYAGVRFASPGAAEMERVLLAWMAELVGYPATASGHLASGGSIANLTAIVAARDATRLSPRDFDRAVVYTSDDAHHSIDKALHVAGLSSGRLVRVEHDDRRRMRPDALEAAVERDRASGLCPWLVVAAAGTTNVGAVDPLQEIAEVCERHELWLHVDAAYGGFFALLDECRPLLAGMERADSLVLDPHKGLFLPYGTGAVLVREGDALRRAFSSSAAYMQDARAGSDASDSPADLSPELTKHWRGLRLWLPLMLFGLAPFRSCLREKRLLARYFHEQVQGLGFEVGPEPDLSVVTYRFVPKRGDADAFNRALLDHVLSDGRVFVSSTTLDGRFMLRLAVLNFRTHLDVIDEFLDILRRGVAQLQD